MRRKIRLGYATKRGGYVYTILSPDDIAKHRSEQSSDFGLFVDTYLRVRLVAADLLDIDALWKVMGDPHVDPVMEAAAIEAIASLRAEGVKL